VVENLISSGIEDHTFGPRNLREECKKTLRTTGLTFLFFSASVDLM